MSITVEAFLGPFVPALAVPAPFAFLAILWLFPRRFLVAFLTAILAILAWRLFIFNAGDLVLFGVATTLFVVVVVFFVVTMPLVGIRQSALRERHRRI